MSPSMKSKSKSKAKAAKEQQKTSPKTSGSTNDESSIPSSACDLETSLVDSSSIVNDNSQFAKINETDDHSISPQGTVSEYDSVSNNGSCSGESEDTKEKAANLSTRLEFIPGCDNDRRDKIRLKNERKHQRQRERRAHELHERCVAYLMSRKLEKLVQKLVAMGFTTERATLALKLNNGKLEESISWLFEGGSEAKDTTNLVSDGNLKIDISEALEQIYALEVKYNCSKQEVERAVVACEGDLQKAENTLKSQKEESHANQSEDSAQNNNSSIRSHGLQTASVSIQQRGNESDFNYYNVRGADSMFHDPENRNPQSLNLNHQNELTQKRWGVSATASNPSNMLQSMQAMSPYVKMEAQPSAFRNDGRMIHQGVGREPVVMMQHPQFADAKQNYLNSMNSIPSGTSSWYVNNVPSYENTRSNGNLLLQNHGMGNVGADRLQQLSQAPYKEYSHVFGQADSSISSGGMGGFYKPMVASSPSPTMPSQSHPQHHGSRNTTASSPALTVPPSLGLFCGHQNPSARSFSSHSHVDWNTGGMVQEFDYNNIDWSLDCPPSSRSGDVWLGFSSSLRNNAGNRMASSYMTGSRNVGTAREISSSAGLRDWTSPFAGKDIFSAPRKFVTFPPM